MEVLTAERDAVGRPALKLTVYFNEALRTSDGLAADRLIDLFDQADARASVLVRGIEGFGAHHRLHTERFENASLNQPLVAVCVDHPDLIDQLVAQVDRVLPSGLVTTERAWLLEPAGVSPSFPPVSHGSVKLTIYCGRSERSGSRPAYQVILDHLRSAGVDGATVFLGVDGTVHGNRRRAKFFSRNVSVPLMIVSVGDRMSVERALPGIMGMVEDPVITVEGIQVCKQDGYLLEPPLVFSQEPSGASQWRKLMIHAAGDTHVGGDSLHYQLVEQLRRSGSAGATSLRGIWGYRGSSPPHGDSVRSLRRTSPVVTIVIDRGSQMTETWEVVDLLTRESGLVTSELVPAHRALGIAGGG